MNFSELLNLDGYLPVYGSTITPESFRPVGENTWEVTAWDAPWHPVTYRVRVEGGTVSCFDGEAEVPFLDLHSGARRAPSPLDLYDRISYYDGTSRVAARTMAAWAGEDVDAMLRRAEHGVVKADDYDINPSRFASPQEMEDHLNELLAETPARVQVEMVAEWPDLGPQNFCHYLVSGEEDQFCLFKYGTYFEQESWAEHLHHLAQVPYIWVRYNGAQLERHLADYCYRRSALPAGIVGPRRTEEEWWLLTLPDVDASLLIPITSSILQLATDDDGQTVSVQLHSAAYRTRQNRLEDSFRRRHGALLNDAQPLSATVVDAALANLAAALTAATSPA